MGIGGFVRTETALHGFPLVPVMAPIAAVALGRKTVILKKPIQTIQTTQTRYQGVLTRVES